MASTASISPAALLTCRPPSQSSSSSISSSSTPSRSSGPAYAFALNPQSRNCPCPCSTSLHVGALRSHCSPRSMAPDEEKMARRSPLDFPIQGTTVSCATRSSPSVNADDMDATPDSDMDGSASSSSCVIKRPWITKLMLGLYGCEKPWLVPWTSFTTFQVMFLWFCTFWLVGSWIIPFAAHYAGCSKDTLTYRGQALYSLITDIAEGTVGLGILHRCLARFKPLPRNWFPFSWRGQWYIDVLLGCLTFPVVNRLSQLNLELLPCPSAFTISYEQSILARDPIASILYVIVVSVCCPIWEEVIFRGFLLPSLTRYLPMWASIFVSAVVFGLAHFNVQRMLPLTFLGLVMGIMFVRSRNLLSSMLLHSLWNGFVFMGLLR